MSRQANKNPKLSANLTATNSRAKYLYTLGDDLFTKTELALQMVNDYEMRKNQIEIPIDSIIFNTEAQEYSQGIHTNLHQDIAEKVNIVGQGTRQYYKIDCKDKAFPLRLQFRNVRNTIRIYASFRDKYPSIDSNEFQWSISRDTRHNIQPRNEKFNSFLYLCIEAMSHIGIMDMKATFYNDILEKRRQGYKIHNGKIILSPLRIDEPSIEEDRLRYSSSKIALPVVAARELSYRTHSNSAKRLKNNRTSYNSMERLKTDRKATPQKQVNRIIDAKLRRQQIASLKTKQRQFVEKAAQSKQIIKEFQKRSAYETEQRIAITKALGPLLLLNRFLLHINKGDKFYVKKFGIFAKVALWKNKVAAKIKMFYKKAIQQFPSKKARLTANLHQGIYLWVRLRHRDALISSTKIITPLIPHIAVCMQLNQSFDQATIFRRKLRFIQKHWKAKYHARLDVIKQFADIQIKHMLIQHPHFRIVEELSVKSGQLTKICVNYIKDVADKFNHMYATYFQTLVHIQQVVALNNKIKEDNIRLAKKWKKIPLKVPDTPIKPFYRFFRDLNILKTMIRGWFEIEYKKVDKRNKKK